jgi:protein-S-isoprenylcysteine O-methyltransferase Ste14
VHWALYFSDIALTGLSVAPMGLFFRNVFFTILMPGMIAGFIPYWILGEQARLTFGQPLSVLQLAGGAMVIAGTVILLTCITTFALDGRGTLSPIDPPKKLVIKGLYRYSRNPMYVGVMAILIGEAIFFRSNPLWFYALFIFVAFNLFITMYEEPTLRRDFGEDYQGYLQKVRRWI